MPKLPQIAVIACGGFLKTKRVMKVEELRIGNWVNTGNFHLPRYRGNYKVKEEWFKWAYKFIGIPLNEECVFELEDKYWDFIRYGTRLIYQDRLHPAIKIEKTKTQWAFYFNDELINFVDYLHEAQNLYFALTRTELTFENEIEP